MHEMRQASRCRGTSASKKATKALGRAAEDTSIAGPIGAPLLCGSKVASKGGNLKRLKKTESRDESRGSRAGEKTIKAQESQQRVILGSKSTR